MRTLIILLLLTTTANAQLFLCGLLDPNCERQNQADDATCRSYGASLGTPAYISCRTQLKTAHDMRRAIIRSAPSTLHCVHVGFSTACNAY